MPSQLSVLLIGTDEGMIETGDALIGRKAFSMRQLDAQRETLVLPDRRLFEVTAAFYTQIGLVPGTVLEFHLSKELVSDITSSAYDAVIIIMEIEANLSLSHTIAAKLLMEDKFWKKFVKRKGAIVVTRADRFRKAQNTGEITVSFMEWMRKTEGFCGILFKEMEERCVLFDNYGLDDVLNNQRHELIIMMDSQVVVGEQYTEMMFKEADMLLHKLERDFGDLKQQVQTKTISLEEDSQKKDERLKEMNNQLERLKQEVFNMQTMQQHFDKQVVNLKDQVHTIEQEKFQKKGEKRTIRERIRGSSFLERIKSLASSHPQLHSRKLLPISLLLLLLLLPLLSSLWLVTSHNRKEVTALDVNSTDFKLEQAVKRMKEIEKHLAGLKILDMTKKQKMEELNQTDYKNVSKIRLEMAEEFTKLKERLLNETAELTEDIRKNITYRILVWDMIESLPLSLPLIMVLTLLLLLLAPVPLPVPWASLLAALLVVLLILQLLLLLVLLGA